METRRALATLTVKTVLLSALAPLAVLAPPSPAMAAPPLWLDTSSKATVAAAYAQEFASSVVDTGWNGDTESCIQGDTSPEHKSATLRRVNFYRALAGVPPVVYSDGLAPAAQAAALVGAANWAFDHQLSPSARCFSPLAATGASISNLALGRNGPAAVDAYMDDGTAWVGHRIWILHPSLDAVATGDVPTPAANALALAYSSPRPTRDGFVAYPGQGWFPSTLLHRGWSVSHPTADFSRASVSLTTPSGAQIPATVTYTGNDTAPTVTFVPDLGAVVDDTVIRVVVANVSVSGATTSFAYDVALFVPNRAPIAQDHVRLTAPRCARSNRFLSGSVSHDPDGDPLSFSVRPRGSAPYVLAVSPSGFSTITPIDPSWDPLSFDVTVSDPYGNTTAMLVTLTPTGSRTCKTPFHPVVLKRSTKHQLSSLIPPPPGTRKWAVTGGCRFSGSSLITRIRPGACFVTLVVTRNQARWTLTRQLTIK